MSLEEEINSESTQSFSGSRNSEETTSAEQPLNEIKLPVTSSIQNDGKASKSASPDNSKLEEDLERKKDLYNDNSQSSTPIDPTDISAQNTYQEEGGEWELLKQKILGWAKIKQLSTSLTQLIKPALYITTLAAILIIIQLYRNVLIAISHIPLAPRLFQFIGITWLINFSISNLRRSQDRQVLFSNLQERWLTFLGKES